MGRIILDVPFNKFEKTTGMSPLVADINEDGHPEFVVIGMMGERVDVYRHDGSLLWNFEIDKENTNLMGKGKAWALAHAFDLDSDGHNEIIVGKNQLYVLDGCTGKVKQSRNFVAGNLSGEIANYEPVVVDGEKRLLVATLGQGVFMLDANLNDLWRRPDLPFSIHKAFIGDPAGDGRKLIVFSGGQPSSFYILDCEGNPLLKQSTLELNRNTGAEDHCDWVDFGQGLILTSFGLLLDSDLQSVWNVSADINHGQTGLIVDADTFVLLDRYVRKVFCYNRSGSLKWTFEDFTPTHFLDQLNLINWHGREKSQLLVGEWACTNGSETKRRGYFVDLAGIYYVTVLDKHGKLIDRISFQDDGHHWERNVSAGWGEGSGYVFDMNGDGREEYAFATWGQRLLLIGAD